MSDTMTQLPAAPPPINQQPQQLQVPTQSLLGDSNWSRNLMLLGGDVAGAANARFGQGFLSNPGGAAFSVGLANALRDQSALDRQNMETQQGLTNTTGQQLINQGIPAKNLAQTLANQKSQLELGLLPYQIEYQKQINQFRLNELKKMSPEDQQSLLSPSIVPPDQKLAMIKDATTGRGLPEGVGLIMAGLPNAKGLIDTESGSDAHAINSQSGAIGLGQILPSTARNPGYGMEGVSPRDLLDPAKNLQFTADYLYNRGKQQFGMTDADWAGATPDAQKKIMAVVGAYGGVSRNDPTQYVHTVLGRMYGNQHLANQTDQPPVPSGQGMAANPNAVPPSAPAPQGMAANPNAAPPSAPAPYQVASLESVPPPTEPRQGISRVPQPPQVAQAGVVPPPPEQAPGQPSEEVHLPLPAGYVTPQEAMQRAAAAQDKARRYGLMGGKEAGFDPAPFDTEAQQWRSYAADTMKSAAQPQTLRGEGSAVVTPYGNIQSNVRVTDILGPDNRHYTATMKLLEANGQPAKSAPGIPAWAPAGTQTIAAMGLSPSEESSQKDAADYAFGPDARKAYSAANATLSGMENIQHQLDKLNGNGPGFWNTGPAAEEKLAFAKALNGAMALVGGNPPFDPDKIASYEDFIKTSKTAGMAIARSMGSHEAASVVTMGLSTVPNVENTPLGAQKVKDVIASGAVNVIDEHAFNATWAQNPNWPFKHNPNDMRGADVAFQQMFPPEKYVQRALSLTEPTKITDPKEVANMLPGTHFVTPDGRRKMAPLDPNVWVEGPAGLPRLKYQPVGNTGIPQ